MYYPINYGYIEGVMAPDGEEQDAYILGVNEPVKKFTGKIIADLLEVDIKELIVREYKSYILSQKA